jgi:ubiquinone biosynthesis protein UbiJ
MSNKVIGQQAICALLEAFINKALTLNINSNNNESLNRLERKTLTLKLAELAFPLSFSVGKQKIQVSSLADHNDCRVDTSIYSLIELKKEQQITTLIKQDKLELQGDVKIAQQFLALAESADIDWQDQLAKHIGDIPTYKLMQLGQFLQQRLQFAGKQIQADASEWLLHEIKAVIHTDEMSRFSQRVSETSLATDRLSNRVDLLLLDQREN